MYSLRHCTVESHPSGGASPKQRSSKQEKTLEEPEIAIFLWVISMAARSVTVAPWNLLAVNTSHTFDSFPFSCLSSHHRWPRTGLLVGLVRRHRPPWHPIRHSSLSNHSIRVNAKSVTVLIDRNEQNYHTWATWNLYRFSAHNNYRCAEVKFSLCKVYAGLRYKSTHSYAGNTWGTLVKFVPWPLWSPVPLK